PFPASRTLSHLNFGSPLFILFTLSGPGLVLALFQSYGMFRRAEPAGFRSVLKYLAALWIVVLLSNLFLFGLDYCVRSIYRQQHVVLSEVAQAVDKLPLDPAGLDAAHPQTVAVDDLAKVYPLSDVTRAWLGTSAIAVFPKPSSPAGRALRKLKNGKLEAPTAK